MVKTIIEYYITIRIFFKFQVIYYVIYKGSELIIKYEIIFKEISFL